MAKTDGICKNKLMFYMYIGVRNAWNTMCIMQVKIKFSSKFYYLKVDSQFPCLLALIIHETRKTENQPRFKNFNLNLIFICNMYVVPFK